MWFKNLAVYRLPTGLKLDTAALEEKLAKLLTDLVAALGGEKAAAI